MHLMPTPSPLHVLVLACRQWAADRVDEDPDYFNRLLAQQAPEYFWIGCADSRVPVGVLSTPAQTLSNCRPQALRDSSNSP